MTVVHKSSGVVAKVWPEDVIVSAVRQGSLGRVSVWRCPCGQGCGAIVAYARERHPVSNRPAFKFAANVMLYPRAGDVDTEGAPMFYVESIGDFAAMLRDPLMSSLDRELFALWFENGLREAILNATDGAAPN